MRALSILLLLLAAIAGPCGAAFSQQDEFKWSAVQSIGNQRDCSFDLENVRWSLVEKMSLLTARSDRGYIWLVDTSVLKPDGSGRAPTKDDIGRPAWFEFTAGHGPRLIHFNYGYHACIYALVVS